jgi:hypothetical protein
LCGNHYLNWHSRAGRESGGRGQARRDSLRRTTEQRKGEDVGWKVDVTDGVGLSAAVRKIKRKVGRWAAAGEGSW